MRCIFWGHSSFVSSTIGLVATARCSRVDSTPGRSRRFSTDFFLEWFGGDRSAIDAFVTGADRISGLTGTADDIVTTCELIVAEQSTSRLRARHGETRSLVLGVAADLEGEQSEAVHRRLELEGGALRTAQSRSQN